MNWLLCSNRLADVFFADLGTTASCIGHLYQIIQVNDRRNVLIRWYHAYRRVRKAEPRTALRRDGNLYASIFEDHTCIRIKPTIFEEYDIKAVQTV